MFHAYIKRECFHLETYGIDYTLANQESSGSSSGRGGRNYYRRDNHNDSDRHRGSNQPNYRNQRDKRQGNGEVDMRKYHKMIADAQNNFSDIVQTEDIKEDCTICCKVSFPLNFLE